MGLLARAWLVRRVLLVSLFFFFLEKIRFRSQLNLQEEKIIHPVCGCSTYAYTHIPTWGAYHSTNATLHLDAGYRRPENLVPEHEVEALN